MVWSIQLIVHTEGSRQMTNALCTRLLSDNAQSLSTGCTRAACAWLAGEEEWGGGPSLSNYTSKSTQTAMAVITASYYTRLPIYSTDNYYLLIMRAFKSIHNLYRGPTQLMKRQFETDDGGSGKLVLLSLQTCLHTIPQQKSVNWQELLSSLQCRSSSRWEKKMPTSTSAERRTMQDTLSVPPRRWKSVSVSLLHAD